VSGSNNAQGYPNFPDFAFDSNLSVYNVRDYGATGNGTTDDAPTIAAAITAAASSPAGGIVYLPKGSYYLGSELVPQDEVVIAGAGIGNTTLLPQGTNAAFHTIRTQLSPLSHAAFRDFTIDGSAQSGAYAPGIKGIFVQYLLRCTFDNLEILNTYATGLGIDYLRECVISRVIVDGAGRGNNGAQPGGNGIGIGVGGWTDTTPAEESTLILGCHVRNITRFGIILERQGTINARGYRIVGCTATLCGSNSSVNQGAGFCDAGATSAVFDTCIAEANLGPGFTVGGGTFVIATDGTNGPAPGAAGEIIGCVARDNQFHSIYFDGLQSAPITSDSGYLIADNEVVDTANGSTGIRCLVASLGSVANLTIRNNRVVKSAGNGIVCKTTGTSSFTDLMIDGNFIANNTNTGIQIDTNITRGTITNNVCTNDGAGLQTKGIDLLTTRTLTQVTFDGGDIARQTTPITISATLTNCTIGMIAGWTAPLQVVADSYSASITPSAIAGTFHTITANNGTAFTINAPTTPPPAPLTQDLTIEVLNSSGGSLGVITWNAAFIFDGFTWTNPANTKKRQATFRWNGSAWICISISSADY